MKQTPLFALFFLFLASIVSAQDFTFYAQDTIELCPCSNQAYPITIQNLGSETSVYTITASEQAADWVTFSHTQVQLEPNTATQIQAQVNSICNIAGAAPLQLFVTDQNDVSRALTQSLIFNQCYDYAVAFGKEMEEVHEAVSFTAVNDYLFCTDQQLIIPILIENKEQFANRYQVFFDGPEWASLQTQTAQLQANSKGVVLISVDTTGIEGTFEFKITVLSELGKVERKAQLKVQVGDCTAFDIELSSDARVCSGATEIIDVTLNNGAALDQTITLAVEGTTFARFQNATLKVPKQGAATTKLFIFTQDEKDFDMEIQAKIGDAIVASQKSHVDVLAADACFGAAFNVRSKITNYYTQDIFSATLVNKGVDKAIYQVSLEGPEWTSVVPRTLNLNPGQEGNLNIALNPKDATEPGEYQLVLKADTNGQLTSETITLSLKKKGIFSQILGTLSFYKYYIYAAVLIILIIGIIAFFFIRIKNKPGKKTEQKKQEKEVPFVFEPLEEEKPKKKESKKEARKQKRASKKAKELAIPKTLIAWVVLGLLIFGAILAVAFVKPLQPVKDFFVLYSMYLLIGVALLVAMLLILKFGKFWSKK